MTDTLLEAVKSFLAKAKEEEVAQDLSRRFEEFLQEYRATTILATKLSAEDVFKKHFAGEAILHIDRP
jgi:hypothetical protein